MEMARKPEVRRFRIADGMILIGFMAFGLAWSGRAWPTFSIGMENPPATWGEAWEWTLALIALALPCLVSCTVALPILRTRKPRPSWRRMARQPGMTACLAATLGLMPFVLTSTILIWREFHAHGMAGDDWKRFPAGLLDMLAMATPSIGFVVMIAWTLLVIQRQWRCERGWIDRAGRLLGSAWMISGGILGTVWLTQLFK